MIANVVEIINSKSILVEWVNATYGQTIVYCEEMPDLRVGNYAYVESRWNFYGIISIAIAC